MTNPTSVANDFESCISLTAGARLVSEKASRRTFFGTLVMVFVVCTAVTTAWCNSMSATGEMPMPGGWTMSMAWMRMPGQTWAGAMASFVWHVGCHDGSDDVAIVDASVVALSPVRMEGTQDAVETDSPRWSAWVTSSLGHCSDWPFSRWARRWQRSKWNSRRWRALFPSRQDWSLSSPAHFSSQNGRYSTLPLAGRRRGATTPYRLTPPRRGGWACISDSIAGSVVPT